MRQNPRQLPNGKWRANLTALDGTRSRPTFRTKQMADKAIRDSIDLRERGELPRTLQPTLKEFMPTAQAAIKPRVGWSTWAGYERNLRLHLLPLVGDLRLSQIDPGAQQRLIADLTAKGLSAAMVHRCYSTLSVVLKVGATLGMCPAPTKTILSLPRPVKFTPKAATVADIEAVADTIDARYRALVILCGYAGLRLSEALGLHPDSIDWEHNQIRVWQTLERRQKGLPVRRKDDTKGHRDREVTLTAPVRAALELHISEGYSTGEWVFHRNGEPVDHSWLDHYVWDPARERAGVSFRFHDLRHAAVGVMARLGGWGPRRVRDEMGHSSTSFTLDTYGFYWDERDDASRERLSDALAEAIAQAKRERVHA